MRPRSKQPLEIEGAGHVSFALGRIEERQDHVVFQPTYGRFDETLPSPAEHRFETANARLHFLVENDCKVFRHVALLRVVACNG